MRNSHPVPLAGPRFGPATILTKDGSKTFQVAIHYRFSMRMNRARTDSGERSASRGFLFLNLTKRRFAIHP
jgi:hypothetical protein